MSTEAKLKYKAGTFDIITNGDHVVCSVSKKKFPFRILGIGM